VNTRSIFAITKVFKWVQFSQSNREKSTAIFSDQFVTQLIMAAL